MKIVSWMCQGVFLWMLFIGCAGTGAAQQYNVYVMEDSYLYEYGPHQQQPPSRISGGTRARVIQGSGDYVLVETIHGERGFMRKGDLKIHEIREFQAGGGMMGAGY